MAPGYIFQVFLRVTIENQVCIRQRIIFRGKQWIRSVFRRTQKIRTLPLSEKSSDFVVLVHLQGLEPWAHWLRVSCSTNWARGAYGDPYRNRTDVKGVRGLCLNRLTNGPYKSRRLPIFTSRFQLTIFGTSKLNFCVRNGNRWNLTVIDTDQFDWISITHFCASVQYF